ncbi:MAG: hypothetical protein QRY72_03945 [Candidatus Rhabdochlamydia sp.]
MPLPKKEGKGPAFSVSKWLKQQVLLDQEEMDLCLQTLLPLKIYTVGSILPREALEISFHDFLADYHDYISHLRQGVLIDLSRRVTASIFTRDPSAIYAEEVKPGGWMAKLSAPLIQLQHHKFFPSKIDHKIHPMVMSLESVSWGLQFGYPQIFFNAAEGTYQNTWKNQDFPNAALFSQLLKWLRTHSVPTTFMWEGIKIATPLRLGKKCFEWIHTHPQLTHLGITVQKCLPS